MPKKPILITRPDHDSTVHYLFHWAESVVEEAKKRGYELLELSDKKSGKKVTTANFQQLIRKKNPRLLVLNGHGSTTQINGTDGEVLLNANKLGKDVNSKLICALSCSSGRVLGPASISAGADGFIGYDEDFVFCNDVHSTSRPLKDQFAEPFRKAASIPALSLIKGHTLKEAFDRSQAEYEKWIYYYWGKASVDPNALEILKTLLLDKHCQRCFGNQASCV